jgi:hypothetical protein
MEKIMKIITAQLAQEKRDRLDEILNNECDEPQYNDAFKALELLDSGQIDIHKARELIFNAVPDELAPALLPLIAACQPIEPAKPAKPSDAIMQLAAVPIIDELVDVALNYFDGVREDEASLAFDALLHISSADSLTELYIEGHADCWTQRGLNEAEIKAICIIAAPLALVSIKNIIGKRLASRNF